jgi:hypothetical protein
MHRKSFRVQVNTRTREHTQYAMHKHARTHAHTHIDMHGQVVEPALLEAKKDTQP